VRRFLIILILVFLSMRPGTGDLDVRAVCVAAQHHTNGSRRFPWPASHASRQNEAHTRY
jgi:hypothetical protein